MSGDRSLEEFASGSGAAESESEADSETTEAKEAETTEPVEADPEATERVDPAGVAPATPTMRFAPDGAVCESCGETVERRWHDDGAFVCADCKAW